MQSSEHLLVSVPVTGLSLAAVREQCSRVDLVALGLYGVGLGVFIDLDHFLLARLYAGDWYHLTEALADPVGSLTDQGDIFDGIRDMREQRLLSHVLLGGALIGVTRRLSRPWGFVTAVVLYCHLLCDLIRDNRIA
jgi:hypothetical protein